MHSTAVGGFYTLKGHQYETVNLKGFRKSEAVLVKFLCGKLPL